MKARFDGTAEEIESFFLKNREIKAKIKSISKFYPNDRDEEMTSETKGRIYVEF